MPLITIATLIAVSLFQQAGSEKPTRPNHFVLKGVATDARGPLVRHVIIVSPLDENSGEPLTRYSIVNGAPGPMMNPKTTTDGQGAFSVEVPRWLFDGFRAGVLSVGAYRDAGGGSYNSSLEGHQVTFDATASVVDAGKVVFQPLKPR